MMIVIKRTFSSGYLVAKHTYLQSIKVRIKLRRTEHLELNKVLTSLQATEANEVPFSSGSISSAGRLLNESLPRRVRKVRRGKKT